MRSREVSLPRALRTGTLTEVVPPMDDGCEFCLEFAGSSIRDELAAHLSGDTRLRRHGSVIVFPTVSPLAVNHVLIAPIRHCCSTRECSRVEQQHLQNASAQLELQFEDATKDMVFFEHGVGRSSSRGCGVTHAHLHAVPLPPDCHFAVAQELRSMLTLVAEGSRPELVTAVQGGDSYLVFGTATHSCLFAGEEVPSQLVRQLVSQWFRQDWDWRSFSRWDSFDATLRSLAQTSRRSSAHAPQPV
jgi:diadenosine tetraphosphate (Ap4A) HIT family hydrolase